MSLPYSTVSVPAIARADKASFADKDLSQTAEESRRSSFTPKLEHTRAAAGELVYRVLETQIDRRGAAFAPAHDKRVPREPQIEIGRAHV